MLAAAGILVRTAIHWGRDDPVLQEVLDLPGAVEQFADNRGSHMVGDSVRELPLIVQAEIFSLYLNPPKPPAPAVSVPPPRAAPVAPAVRPVMASAQFQLRATCYYPSNPEASRALVWEPGGDGKRQRWVKEGTRLGHFVVQKIESGVIVCLNGPQRHELKVEQQPARTSLVKRYEPVAAHTGLVPVESDLMTEVNVVGKENPR